MSTPATQPEPATHPLSWIRQIPGDLFQIDDRPLLGSSPPFNWTEFALQIGTALELPSLSIEQQGEWQWLEAKDLLSGLGDQLKCFVLTITPLLGKVFFVIPESDILQLVELLLLNNSSNSNEEIEPAFLQAFSRFLAVEAMTSFEKVFEDKKLSPLLCLEDTLPTEHCLGTDISITLPQKVLHARLLLSQSFRKAWQQRYLPLKTFLPTSAMAENLDVVIHLEAGRVNLTISEWKKIQPGDFVFLDTCSLDPDEDKGRVMLVINGLPYFRGRVKQGSLKILEHPLYYEVDKSMNSPTEENGDDLFDEELTDFDIEETSHDETSEVEDFDIEEAVADKPAPTAPQAESADEVPAEVVTTTENRGAIPPLEEISLPVIIELGRIQMTIKKLLELQPGNMLELDIHPETGVDLVVNGKRIARGELLRIGEALGVRIQELS